MAIDTEKLLEEVRITAGIGDNAWLKPTFSGLPNKTTLEHWLQQEAKTALRNWDIPCLQKRLKSANSQIAYINSGLQLPLPDNFLSFDTGFIGAAQLKIESVSDIMSQTLTDSNNVVYAYHSLNELSGQEVFEFSSSKTGIAIDIGIFVYPKELKALPWDLEKYLWIVLSERALLSSQNANLDGMYKELGKMKEIEIASLKSRYGKKSRSFYDNKDSGNTTVTSLSDMRYRSLK